MPFSKYKQVFDSPKELDIQEVIRSISQGSDRRKRFLVKSGNKFFHRSIDDVGYFMTDAKVVFLHEIETDRRFPIDLSLEELTEQHLPSHQFFSYQPQ